MWLISVTHKAFLPRLRQCLFLLWESLRVFTVLWRDPASEQLMLARSRAPLTAPLTPADMPSSHHPPVQAGDGETRKRPAQPVYDHHKTVMLCFPSEPRSAVHPRLSVWNDACHRCFNVCFMVHVALGSVSMEKVHYCERFIEFMIDLEVSLHSSICSDLLSVFLIMIKSAWNDNSKYTVNN